jgi:hypothetical protein
MIHAQTFISPGTTELGGSILFSSQTVTNNYPGSDNDMVNTFIFSPYIGAMMSGGFEIGVIPSYISQRQGNYSYSVLGLYLAPAVNFQAGEASYPFIEFLLGYNVLRAGYQGKSTEEGIGWGIDGGVKTIVGTNGLLLFQVQYLSQNFKGTNSSVDETLNTFAVGLGFSVFILKKTETKK